MTENATETAADGALARLFHETYERLAPSFGYETRKASAVPWADVPEKNKALMIAVAGEIRRGFAVEAERLTSLAEMYREQTITITNHYEAANDALSDALAKSQAQAAAWRLERDRAIQAQSSRVDPQAYRDLEIRIQELEHALESARAEGLAEGARVTQATIEKLIVGCLFPRQGVEMLRVIRAALVAKEPTARDDPGFLGYPYGGQDGNQ